MVGAQRLTDRSVALIVKSPAAHAGLDARTRCGRLPDLSRLQRCLDLQNDGREPAQVGGHAARLRPGCRAFQGSRGGGVVIGRKRDRCYPIVPANVRSTSVMNQAATAAITAKYKSGLGILKGGTKLLFELLHSQLPCASLDWKKLNLSTLKGKWYSARGGRQSPPWPSTLLGRSMLR